VVAAVRERGGDQALVAELFVRFRRAFVDALQPRVRLRRLPARPPGLPQ
jgi:hypothetical protein